MPFNFLISPIRGLGKLSSKSLLADDTIATYPFALRPFDRYWAIKVFG